MGLVALLAKASWQVGISVKKQIDTNNYAIGALTSLFLFSLHHVRQRRFCQC